MLYLVTYHQHDVAHARTVEACCEAAAIAATQRHARHGATWLVRPTRDDAVADIIGGSAVCPLNGCHKETAA